MPTDYKTELQRGEQRVSLSEAHVKRQRELIADRRNNNLPVENAERLLKNFEEVLAQRKSYLAHLRNRAQGRSSSSASIETDNAPGPTRLASRRILVMEDDFLIAAMIAEWLQKARVEVIGPWTSTDDALALSAAKLAEIDAAILDVTLTWGKKVFPVSDRLDLLGIPYAFLTGDSKSGIPETYKHRPLLEKPISESQLLEAAEQLIISVDTRRS